MPRLSVALCTYNGEQFLQEQLDSYLLQTRQPDEVMVRDDGSTDGTVAILKQFVETAPFPVRILPGGDNLGYARNFERVVAACSGDLIALSDQDDVWVPEKLARLEAALGDDLTCLLAFSDARLVDTNLRPLGQTIWESLNLSAVNVQRIREGGVSSLLYYRPVVTGATVCFRRELAEQAFPSGVDFWHDAWLALAAELLGRVEAVEDSLVLYRQHGANTLGAPKAISPLWKRVRNALGRSPQSETAMRESETTTERFYGAAHAYARSRGWLRPVVDRRLGERVRHAAFRSDLGPRRVRLQRVTREFASGRYIKFSDGIVSALYHATRDMIR